MEELPGTVQVGPFLYILRREAGVDSDSNWGECDNRLRLLDFAQQTGPRQLPATLIHELIHAVESVYGVKLEEEQVVRLTHGLTQALQSTGFWPKELKLEGEE